jgi:prefoldin subunit 5
MDKEPILSNKRTREIDEYLKEIDSSIFECEAKIATLTDKVETSHIYNFERQKNREINIIQNKIKKLDSCYWKIRGEKSQLESLILEVKMLPQYVEYAKEHTIEYDPEDDYDIFRQCNEHHHYDLLEGHETYTKCYKQGRVCSCDVILRVWGNKEVRGDCECGFGEWCKEDPPENLSEFNITDEHVYGEMNW